MRANHAPSMFKIAFFLGVNSNKLQEQEVHAYITSRSQTLAKRTLSVLQLHFKACFFNACVETPFLWRNQRNACKAYIISSLTYRAEGSSHRSRRIEEKTLRIHPFPKTMWCANWKESVSFCSNSRLNRYFFHECYFLESKSLQPYSLLPQLWNFKAIF